MEIARVTPSLPQWGEAAQGASPLTPMSGWFFFTLPRSTAMLHGASPDEAVSARGPIAIRYRCPSFSSFKEHGFYRANIPGVPV
jgi:hypothetical protein